MTLDEILRDIHGLDERLRVLEQQYGLLSEDLYTLYRLGELEQSRDLIRWVGYYELRQERQRAYEAALRERLLKVRRAEAGAPISLSSSPIPTGRARPSMARTCSMDGTPSCGRSSPAYCRATRSPFCFAAPGAWAKRPSCARFNG